MWSSMSGPVFLGVGSSDRRAGEGVPALGGLPVQGLAAEPHEAPMDRVHVAPGVTIDMSEVANRKATR